MRAPRRSILQPRPTPVFGKWSKELVPPARAYMILFRLAKRARFDWEDEESLRRLPPEAVFVSALGALLGRKNLIGVPAHLIDLSSQVVNGHVERLVELRNPKEFFEWLRTNYPDLRELADAAEVEAAFAR